MESFSDRQMERLALLTEIKRLDSEIAAAEALEQGMSSSVDRGVSSRAASLRAKSLRESQHQLRTELAHNNSPSPDERPSLTSVDQDLRD